jgi:hypothetical protein
VRVQEPELGAVRQRCFDQIAIAPLNDPLVVTAKELAKEGQALLLEASRLASLPGK